jgi:hypothetical protein
MLFFYLDEEVIITFVEKMGSPLWDVRDSLPDCRIRLGQSRLIAIPKGIASQESHIYLI